MVSEETMKLLGHGNITTACSAVVNYIEKYNPELISQMLPVISTMTIFNKEEVVIFDEVEDSLIHMNPSFQKMFFCNNGILGRRITYLLNGDGFEKLARGEQEQFEAIRSKYGVKYHEILYALRGENQYVGIYSNISQVKFDDSQIDLIKRQTLEHVKELQDHQISFSQQLAHFLGKNTAQSEDLVRQITDLFDEEKK